MRFVTFLSNPSSTSWHEGRPGLLVADGEAVVDLHDAAAALAAEPPPPEPTHLHWFDLEGPWFAFAERVARAVARDPDAGRRLGDNHAWHASSEVRLLAPVPRPGKIIAIGLNYRDHAAEARMPVPESPVVFAKFPTAVVGPGMPIVLPAASRRVDYEAELAVVVGRRVRGIARGDALGAVFGFTNANDVSERDFQKADGQWVRAKSCDTFAPLGPAVVTLDELADPHALRIELRLNGETMQASNTGQFVFDVPSLVAFVADTITLEPGDVILTGTPPGVGFARRPPVFLHPGDRVEVEIEGLGVLRNPVIAAPSTTP